MTPRKILLIGWDAADWKIIRPLMDASRMPNVRRLVENGATAQISTLYPPISPMLWTSIATGKRPFKHGIHGFSEPSPDGRGVQPVTNLSRKSKAVWNILNQNGLRSIVVGWWPSHPAEPINGVMVSDQYHRATGPVEECWPLAENAVHPPELHDTLADLRVHPDLLTPDLVEPFIPLAREIDQEKDDRLGLFLRTLAECMSVHSAATWLLDNRPWDFFAVYYDAIDHFCHGFMKYHPPRQAWVGERDFELYQNVVSQAYQMQDRMLGTLIEKAGDDATVILVSDHGFHPDHLRPASIPDIPAAPTIEHREYGILALRGQGIKGNETIHGSSVLDVAPTILTLYGLPAGEDMDGKVLAQVFTDAPQVDSIPSWDDVRGEDGCHPPHMRLVPAAARESLEQMIALGYIERPDENRELAVENTIRELRYNLGESYQDADRHLEAREIFRELCAADPDEPRFAVRLFVSCQALGLHDEMRRIADDLDGRRRALFEEAKVRVEAFRKEPPASDDARRELARWRNLGRYQPSVAAYLKAQVLIAEKRYGEALTALEHWMDAHLMRPALLLQIGELYLRLGRGRQARQVYEKVLSVDSDNAQAHLGLCRVALRSRRFSAAAQSALDALERIHQSPMAHFLLGKALTGLGEYQQAAQAFRTALSFNPNFPEAHVHLAALLEKHLGDGESAREHRRLARRMRAHPVRPPAPDKTARDTEAPRPPEKAAKTAATVPLEESLIVVTGLPRSGTSALMQMLEAGGVDILSDGVREADEDNPRGYFEFEPVKNLMSDSNWLFEGRGKAVKIVAPLVTALPPGLACRVILSERDLEEVLDSQERMLQHRGQHLDMAPERRRILKEEYARTLARVKSMLAGRPDTQLLVIDHGNLISHPQDTARKVNQFLGGKLKVEKMAAAIDPALHRNRNRTLLTPSRRGV